MPVKLGSKLPDENEARIEIIPLIDIMFFLLASFMLVSLSMVNLKSVKVNLPTATTATTDTKNDFVSISVDKSGAVLLDKQPVGLNELAQKLAVLHQTKENTRVFISGDKDARHGDVIHVLDVVRSAGIEKVAFEIRESTASESMNRRLQFLNLFGVLALAVLCVAQWRHDRDLNLEVGRLDKTRQTQEQKISEQEESARGLTSDLEHFKTQFKEQHDDLESERHKSRDAENEAAKLTAERDQLKESVTNWVNAVAQRDALVKEANGRIESLAADLNATIRKYNELTTNYNGVVKELNESRAKPASTNAQ